MCYPVAAVTGGLTSFLTQYIHLRSIEPVELYFQDDMDYDRDYGGL